MSITFFHFCSKIKDKSDGPLKTGSRIQLFGKERPHRTVLSSEKTFFCFFEGTRLEKSDIKYNIID